MDKYKINEELKDKYDINPSNIYTNIIHLLSNLLELKYNRFNCLSTLSHVVIM
jgi:hypothetical protein